jgi:cytochrome c553
MAQVAMRLDDQDIAALAAYYQQMGGGNPVASQ